MLIHAGAVSGAIAIAFLVSGSPAAARPLGFDAALALAAEDAPSLRARGLEVEARRSAAVAAGELPDPRLGVGLDNYPVSGPPAFTFDGDSMTTARLGVSQDIPSSAKRRAQVGRAAADIGEAEAMLSGEARRVRVETALAWIDLAYADRRLAAVEAQEESVERLGPASTSGVASGSARPAQTLDVRRATAALADRRSEVASARARAKAVLARWTGDPEPEAVGEVPQFDLDPAALRRALDDYPSLAIAAARTRQAKAEVAVARAGKTPDLGVELAYQHRAGQYGDMVSAGVTVGLPLFARRRQDPIIAARTATASAAFAEEEDNRRALVAELDSALADHVMHHEQWMRSRETLLPLARDRVALETASYSAGRATILDVIEARTALADAELEALDREAAVARDAAKLVLTYGSAPQ